jgi:hypothetical protein
MFRYARRRDIFIETFPDGSELRGRFANRRFIPVGDPAG